jgi:hypothetical protein
VEAPWWWAYIVMIETHVQSIHERSAYDPEKMVAPKSMWPLSKSKELESWYEGREASAQRPPRGRR